MAGFTMLALGLGLGALSSMAAKKLKKAPVPGATADQQTPTAAEAPKPPNAQQAASDNAAAAQQAGVRARKRVAGGTAGTPRARKPVIAGMGGAGVSTPQVQPRALIGY